MGIAEGKKYFEDAVKALNIATTVFKREQYPMYWANVRFALGYTYHLLGSRVTGMEGEAYLKLAVSAYKESLTIFTVREFPDRQKETQTHLARSEKLLVSRKNTDIPPQ